MIQPEDVMKASDEGWEDFKKEAQKDPLYYNGPGDLLDTPEGLILIDTTYPETRAQLIDSASGYLARCAATDGFGSVRNPIFSGRPRCGSVRKA